VIGVDMNDDMLTLARRNAPEVARRVGHANVSFKKGKIQDLRLDRDWLDEHLRAQPVRSEADLARVEAQMAEQRRQRPLVPDASIDVVISSCVLNLVRPEDKRDLFFPCTGGTLLRHPRETKGEGYCVTTEAAANGCGPKGAESGSCC